MSSPYLFFSMASTFFTSPFFLNTIQENSHAQHPILDSSIKGNVSLWCLGCMNSQALPRQMGISVRSLSSIVPTIIGKFQSSSKNILLITHKLADQRRHDCTQIEATHKLADQRRHDCTQIEAPFIMIPKYGYGIQHLWALGVFLFLFFVLP